MVIVIGIIEWRGNLAEYIRMVSYLNMYKNGEKDRNCGFAKIDSRNGICRVQINIQMPFIRERSRCTVYFFIREDGKMYGVSAGEMLIENGRGFFGINTVSTDMVHKGVGISEVSGIYISTGYEGMVIASEWDDIAIEPDKFYDISEREEYSVAEVPEDNDKEIDAADTTNELQDNICKEVASEVRSGLCNAPDIVVENDNVCAMTFWDKLGRRCVKLDKISGFDECVRMKPNDIVCLPKRYWVLGQNSFLLHGYYTHRYLMAAKCTADGRDKYVIGVPGKYQSNEKIMAAMFGFGEFSGEEQEGKEGYWCMELE